jgi:hypothetical protein
LLAVGSCLFLCFSTGCGDDEGEGVAPGISNLFLGPETEFVHLRGEWVGVTVSMDYADPDGDPAFVRMRFRYCGEGEMRKEDIAPTGITGDQAGVIWISTDVPAACPAGTYVYEFSLFDQKGHESNTLEATLTLTPFLGTGP